MGRAARANTTGLFPNRPLTKPELIARVLPTKQDMDSLKNAADITTVSDPLFWRLEYPSGLVVDEPSDNASIRTAPKRPSKLSIIKPDGTSVCEIPIDLSKGERPIFYRKRSADWGGDGKTRLDATVFGKCWDGGNTIETSLWMGANGTFTDCPEWAGDRTMVEIQFNEMWN